MAISRSGTHYLERKQVFLSKRPRPRYVTKTLKSHFRPIFHLPELQAVDSPNNRVITQVESDRVPCEPLGDQDDGN